MTRAWHNWAGTVRCEPAHLLAPSDEDGIAAALAFAERRDLAVRAAGSGHSFNPLATTAGLLLDLTQFRGVLALDPVARTITVRSGTPVRTVNQVLARVGLALANVGTLDRQTVAGAIATGNHGTGIDHGPLSDNVVALRMITADGQIRTLDRTSTPDLFRCAVTGLGALGIITDVTLGCVPSFRLRVVEQTALLDAVLDGFTDWTRGADHVSFTWLPWRETVATRSLSRTPQPVTPGSSTRRYASTVAEVRCGVLGLVGSVLPGSVPRLTTRLAAGAGRGGGDPSAASGYVDVSHRAFSFVQPVRFLAMEHALPVENVPAALRVLRGALRRAGRYSPYSIMVRVGRGDDAPLSPAYRRVTGYVNLTVPRTAAYLELLRVVEHVLREQDGRPHWGKAHTATAEILAPRYPEWDTFQRVRAELDPDGRFSNDYVRRVLGPVRVGAGR